MVPGNGLDDILDLILGYHDFANFLPAVKSSLLYVIRNCIFIYEVLIGGRTRV
jgi:hypothetical protein